MKPLVLKIILVKFGKKLACKVKTKFIILLFAHYFLTLTSWTETLTWDKIALEQGEEIQMSAKGQVLELWGAGMSLPRQST